MKAGIYLGKEQTGKSDRTFYRWLDTAGAESILDDFLHFGKIESRFVSVAAKLFFKNP